MFDSKDLYQAAALIELSKCVWNVVYQLPHSMEAYTNMITVPLNIFTRKPVDMLIVKLLNMTYV